MLPCHECLSPPPPPPHPQGAMSAQQICEVEKIVQDMISGKKPVYAKETPLSVAKEIQGLRAVFDEVGTRGEL